jgi:hypothetical protein
MNAHVKPTRIATVLFALVLASVAGCGHDIGDECRTSADCDPNGTRACDLSQPGGYCTIAGCDENSCPEDSACLLSFPEQYLSTPKCDAACEDVCPVLNQDGEPKKDAEGHIVVQSNCTADELCLNSGQCARRSFLQRACVKTCSGNDDCRGGYQCRDAQAPGSMLLSRDPNAKARFCAPAPAPAE